MRWFITTLLGTLLAFGWGFVSHSLFGSTLLTGLGGAMIVIVLFGIAHSDGGKANLKDGQEDERGGRDSDS